MSAQGTWPRIGLALGGGGARGAAHVGVLRVLQSAGIPIHCVAGTSVGATVGAAYAAGLTVDSIEAIFARLRLRDLFRPSLAADGLVDNSPLGANFERAIGPLTIEDLRLPFATVATDANTGEAVELRRGRLAPVLRAATALPGLVRPVAHEGRMLVDGGLVHKVPVRLARSLGADLVIAVDLSDPPTWQRRPRNPAELLLRAIEFMGRKMAAPELGEADLLVQPQVSCGLLQFGQAREQISHGEAAAQAALAQLQGLLAGWALAPVLAGAAD